MGYDVFISYASADLQFAEELHERLVGAGFLVWFDRARLKPGFEWHKEIEAGCDASRIVIPVLTPRWKDSWWTKFETYGAECVVPLLFDGEFSAVSTPPLRRFQTDLVDLRQGPRDWDRLFEAIRNLLAIPAPNKIARLAHVRYHANRYFVGREDLLNQLHEEFHPTPTPDLTPGRVRAITGLGGMGKTTFARQYVEKFWRCYRQILWVDCRFGMEVEFARLHDLLVPSRTNIGLSESDKASAALRELNSREDRLLIVDNAPDELSIQEWIPKAGNCRTLITSRFSDWSAAVQSMSLGALPEDLATTFLLDRTGRRDPSAIDPDELVACRRLVEATAGLPLALEQAAAYIHQQGSRFGFADYMRLYEEATKELLSKGVLGSTEYPDSVATTWKTTVRQLSAEAAALLRLLSYVATTPLQLIALYDNVRLVRDEAAGLPYGLSVMLIDVNSIIRGEGSTGQSNEMWIREKIRELTAYSMLQSDGESIVVHPLVQVVERLNTASQPRGDRDTIHRSTELIFKAASGDPGDVDSWSIWEPLEPHVREVARHADLSGITNLTANLLVRYSQFLSSKSQFPQAEASARRAITIHEVSSHINLPRGLSALAMILESTNRPQEAEPLFRRALEIAEEADGPHHPRVAQCLNDLSVFLVNTGRVAEAEPLIRRALAIDEATHGPVHSAVARDLHQLARVLDDEERWDEAELLLRRALAVSEKCHGPEHPDVARDLGSLAMLLQDTGRSGEAASLLQRALAIDQARFGPNHPSVAVRLNNLAHLVSPTEAEALLGRALVIWSSNLGSDHPTVALCLNNLASIHFGLNRLQDAEQGFRRSLEIYLRSFVATGQRHPKMWATIHNYTEVLTATGLSKAQIRKSLDRLSSPFDIQLEMPDRSPDV